jgi:hypothetical protein
MVLVTRIDFAPPELNAKHVIVMEAISPSGKTMMHEEAVLKPESATPPVVVPALIIFDLSSMIFDEPGEYQFRLAGDGKPLKTTAVHVRNPVKEDNDVAAGIGTA